MAATGPYPDLISLAQVRNECALDNVFDADDRLERYRVLAQAIVIDYLKVDETAFDVTLPRVVEGAMLWVAHFLYNPNDFPQVANEIELIAPILMRQRDPTLV